MIWFLRAVFRSVGATRWPALSSVCYISNGSHEFELTS